MLKAKKKFKNLFKTTDYTFCISETCLVKEQCVRNVLHYEKEWLGDWISCTINEEKCGLFMEVRYV